jgi:Fe-S-cluster containining protein
VEGLSFSAWLDATRKTQQRKTRGADVPCGSCNACCRGSFFIHIRPEELKTLARIPKALRFPAPGLPKGHVLMGYNEKGHCPMLVEGQCSIYQDRPQTCRDFDCRVFTATGLTLDAAARSEVQKRADEWRFTYPDATAAAEQAAVRAAAAFLRDRADAFAPGQLPLNPAQLAMLALKVYDVFMELAALPAAARPPDGEVARAVMEAWAAIDG